MINDILCISNFFENPQEIIELAKNATVVLPVCAVPLLPPMVNVEFPATPPKMFTLLTELATPLAAISIVLVFPLLVAPVAKLNQQRDRRYKSWYTNEIQKMIEGKNYQESWNTSAITPGTKFMKLLNLFNWVESLISFFTFNVGGGGKSSGGGSTTQTSYSTNLPEYAKPYYEELMKQSAKQVYATDAEGGVKGVIPYSRWASSTETQGS